MQITQVIALGTAVCCTFLFSSGSSNLLQNADFETGDLVGWNDPGATGTVGVPGVGAQDGSFAGRLEFANGGGSAEYRQSFPATAGDEFLFSGHMLTEAALPAGDTFGLLKIVFRDSMGNDLIPTSSSKGQINTTFPGVESLPFLNSTSTINTWVLTEAQGAAPAGTTEVLFLVLNIDFQVPGTGHPMWFDNMIANDVSAGGNLLANSSFETGDNTGWENPGSGISIGQPGVGAHMGSTFAARFEKPGAVSELSQNMPANPGDEFSFSGYMLTENTLPAGDTFGVFKIVFRDSMGNDLPPASVSAGQENVAFPGIDSLPFLNDTIATDTWLFSEAQGVAPAGTVEVLFLALNVDFAGGSNPMWFDTVSACKIEAVVTVTPTTVTRTRGTYVSGDETSLASDDNVDYQLQRSSFDIRSRTEFEVEGTSPFTSPTGMELTLVGSVFARSAVNQTIELFDYNTSAWELVDTRVASRMGDATATVTVTGDPSRFVEPGTNRIEARVHFESANAPRQNFASNTDMFTWTITQ